MSAEGAWVIAFFFSRFFQIFSQGKTLIFVEFRTFTFMEGKKMRCELNLPRNQMMGEIT